VGSKSVLSSMSLSRCNVVGRREWGLVGCFRHSCSRTTFHWVLLPGTGGSEVITLRSSKKKRQSIHYTTSGHHRQCKMEEPQPSSKLTSLDHCSCQMDLHCRSTPPTDILDMDTLNLEDMIRWSQGRRGTLH
jgi:hypothetical protein